MTRPEPGPDPAARAGVGDGRASVTTSIDAAGARLVHLEGEVDIANGSAVQSALESALAGSPERVTIDLAGLEFMDSSGLAVLLAIGSEVEELRLRRPTAIVRRIIEVSGLSDVLRVDP